MLLFRRENDIKSFSSSRQRRESFCWDPAAFFKIRSIKTGALFENASKIKKVTSQNANGQLSDLLLRWSRFRYFSRRAKRLNICSKHFVIVSSASAFAVCLKLNKDLTTTGTGFVLYSPLLRWSREEHIDSFNCWKRCDHPQYWTALIIPSTEMLRRSPCVYSVGPSRKLQRLLVVASSGAMGENCLGRFVFSFCVL